MAQQSGSSVFDDGHKVKSFAKVCRWVLQLATIYLQKHSPSLILKSRANTNDSDADDHCLVDNEDK